jgi:hypothetical protein
MESSMASKSASASRDASMRRTIRRGRGDCARLAARDHAE